MQFIDVWREPCLSFNAKGVFCLLRRFADNTTLICWPSLGKLAEVANLSKPTLRKALHELETAHLLRIMRCVNQRGVQYSNRYQLLSPSGSGKVESGVKNIDPGVKELDPPVKYFTPRGKNFYPNLSNRTIPSNFPKEGERERKPRRKIPNAYVSLGIDPQDYQQDSKEASL